MSMRSIVVDSYNNGDLRSSSTLSCEYLHGITFEFDGTYNGQQRLIIKRKTAENVEIVSRFVHGDRGTVMFDHPIFCGGRTVFEVHQPAHADPIRCRAVLRVGSRGGW
jgi:hypothetical protein